MVGLAVHLYLNIRQERKEIEVRDLNIFSLKKNSKGRQALGELNLTNGRTDGQSICYWTLHSRTKI